MKPVLRIAVAVIALSPVAAAAQTSGLTRQQVVDDLVRAERAGYYPGVDDQRYLGSFLDIREGIYTGASVYRSATPRNLPAPTDGSLAN
ncbi:MULTISPECIES: DUF4148 domain-containing protein [unclassified Caballeronia]|uniref:DUF4148 domain-containing protein n=1 Tax=unclassified Caballeronia TaxID=2646786 RepID=UPI002858CF41|nr:MULTISPECIES: DUF4148 domain-containing protein [unclassified Caballeronia]MDR5739688.1 DUF4148 domain-containing protein [Caballeronia sp. LZ016]MDR5808154.1 DUF4148 domain-containing protein [Caballeronia sp. LZ019]